MPDATATIRCPHCGHREAAAMPATYCLHLYECTNCNAVLKPKPGDCCVFCSYSDRVCPPKRLERDDRHTIDLDA